MRLPHPVFLPLALALGACIEQVAGDPQVGAVDVELLTTGGDIDLDGYVLSIDNSYQLPVPASGDIRSPLLAPGGHVFVLLGMASNCQTVSGNRRTVQVSAGEAVALEFHVNCLATGFRLSVAVLGADTDPMFGILVNGIRSPDHLEANGSREVTRLAAGSHAVRLADVADNCRIEPAETTVVVELLKVTPVVFTVRCIAVSGAVLIQVRVTGADVDQSGYVGSVSGVSGVVGQPGENFVVPNVPPGTREVRLGDVAPNCEITSPHPVEVVVTAGTEVSDTVLAGFDVACERHWGIAFLRDGRPSVATIDAQEVEGISFAGGRLSWSPDGRKLAFGCGGVCIMDLDVPGVLTLGLDAAGLSAEDVTWSPDGTRLLFSAVECYPGYDYGCLLRGLGLTTPAGGPWTFLPLPATVLGAFQGTWAPDGFAIAFTCEQQHVIELKICVVRPDGSGFAQLSSGAGIDSDPAWSPDGTRIAFATWRFGPIEVVIMNADGSGLRRLTPSALGRHPAWSRDGARLLYSSNNPASSGLTLVNPDGSGAVRLTTRPDDFPSWRP